MTKKGFFNDNIIKDEEILFIPSGYNTHWSKEMNKIFKKYFTIFDNNTKYNSYLRYHKNTFEYYYNFFDKIRNDKKIKYIVFQNILEDYDWRLSKLSNKKIYGFLHSFSGAETDIKKDYYEEFVINSATKIFCCSEYFKKEVLKKGYDPKKFEVIGFPFTKKEIENKKDNIFIFNHRLLKYKNHKLFIDKITPILLERYNDLKIVITTPQGGSTDIMKYLNNINNNRIEIFKGDENKYYNLLKKSKYGMTLSENDNFGTSYAYSLLEGIYYFCPNRLSFPEIVNKDFLYNNLEDFFDKFDKVYNQKNLHNNNIYIQEFLEKFEEKIIIKKIIKILKND
jgi:hypothetical protein